MLLLSLGILIAGLTLAGQDGDLTDLRTRKTGTDWPDFLGPRRDGKSPENGLLTSWPKHGPRIVWSRELGESFGTCTIRLGRLFHFDRYGDRARLTCMKSETGEELWKFEYATDYVDGFGSNNGPRCVPVVDGDRVYIFDSAGMLHCLRITNGAVVWKKDTSAEFGVVSQGLVSPGPIDCVGAFGLNSQDPGHLR